MQVVQKIYSRFFRFWIALRQLKKGDVKMAEDRTSLMTAREAAKYLRVSMFTLSKIESNGGLVPYRTPGGHRRYSLRMLNQYLNNSRRSSHSPQ
jgi:excisionase family DNA binding protein